MARNKNIDIGDVFILNGEKEQQIVIGFNRAESYPSPSWQKRIIFFDSLDPYEYILLGKDKRFVERLNGKLDKKTRDDANDLLYDISSGSPNGAYYPNRSSGFSAVFDACAKFGIHNASGMMQFWDIEAKRNQTENDSGKINIEIAFSRLSDEAEDNFDYMQPITNSELVVSWYELQNSYEIIAYLS